MLRRKYDTAIFDSGKKREMKVYLVGLENCTSYILHELIFFIKIT